MKASYLLPGDSAQALYDSIGNLPIIDYHCHLSPMEIYEDKPFDNIGEMWLRYDHYKWRLMRTAGIDEYYITGDASRCGGICRESSAVSLVAHGTFFVFRR